jgi:hypothetical protein
MIKSKTRPFKLATHGIDPRALKNMTLFLQGPCEGKAVLVDDFMDADYDIFDADVLDSKKLLDKHLQADIQRPVIVLTLREFVPDGVLQLLKPIKTSDMLLVLNKAKKLAAELRNQTIKPENPVATALVNDDLFKDDFFDFISSSSWDEPRTPQGTPQKLREVSAPEKIENKTDLQESKTSQNEPDERKTETSLQVIDALVIDQAETNTILCSEVPFDTHSESYSVPENTEEKIEEVVQQELKTFVSDLERRKTSKHQTAMRLDEKSFKDYIEEMDDFNLNDPRQFGKAQYNQNEYFQGVFQSALLTSTEKNQALLLESPWCPITLFPKTQEVWLDARDSELNSFAGIKIRHKNIQTDFVVTQLESLEIQTDYALEKFHNMDAFVWKLACWTSKGRYPQEIDYKLPVVLENWPNFTRLLITPHALRIAALLIQGPRTMDNVANMLNIKPQYVFVFISAAYATGLLHQPKTVINSLGVATETKPGKGRGLLSRIMNKLRN